MANVATQSSYPPPRGLATLLTFSPQIVTQNLPLHFLFQIRNNKKTAILVREVNPKKKLFLVYRPNTGKQLKLETYAEIKKKYKKVNLLRRDLPLCV